MTDSFLSRLDRPELEKLCEDTGQIDSLSLVSFSNVTNYRLYGLLLLPTVLLHGGRLLFIGTWEKFLVGEGISDEMVIIRYPCFRKLFRILSGRYYSLVNRVCKKRVRHIEFSFNKPFRESSDLWKKGLRLIVLFKCQEGRFGNTLDTITNILGKYPVIQLYASRKVGSIPPTGKPGLSNLHLCRYNGVAIFSIIGGNPERFTLREETISDLKAVTTDISLVACRSTGKWRFVP